MLKKWKVQNPAEGGSFGKACKPLDYSFFFPHLRVGQDNLQGLFINVK